MGLEDWAKQQQEAIGRQQREQVARQEEASRQYVMGRNGSFGNPSHSSFVAGRRDKTNQEAFLSFDKPSSSNGDRISFGGGSRASANAGSSSSSGDGAKFFGRVIFPLAGVALYGFISVQHTLTFAIVIGAVLFLVGCLLPPLFTALGRLFAFAVKAAAVVAVLAVVFFIGRAFLGSSSSKTAAPVHTTPVVDAKPLPTPSRHHRRADKTTPPTVDWSSVASLKRTP